MSILHERKARRPYRVRKRYPRFCFNCGLTFQAARFDARYCSPKCRKVWNRVAIKNGFRCYPVPEAAAVNDVSPLGKPG